MAVIAVIAIVSSTRATTTIIMANHRIPDTEKKEAGERDGRQPLASRRNRAGGGWANHLPVMCPCGLWRTGAS